ncbi:sigma 54-interacting transcriptional regulator [Desulfocurvus sp. DL9XJH121]
MEAHLGKLSVGQFRIDSTHAVTSWDPGAEALTGLSARSMVGGNQHWRAFLPEEHAVLIDWFLDRDFEAARNALGDAYICSHCSGEEWTAIGSYLNARGDCRAMLARVRPDAGNQGAIQDIYDLEYISNAFQTNVSIMDGLHILSEHVPAGVCLFVDGIIVMANQRFCNMFGYDSFADLHRRPSSSLLVEQERDRHSSMLRSLTKQTDTGAKYQWTGLDKNGRKVWFEGRPTPIDLNGRQAILSFVLDISEFKMNEETMKMETQELRAEHDRLKASMNCRMRLSELIGKSQMMQDVYEAILRAAASSSGTIIYGETGTGKELVARAIHQLSPQNGKPFVPVNCGAIPEELFESEFFGHRKGAFTGAYANKRGLLDHARGGTLFLDELGELSPGCQAKLLRVLGSHEYTPVGEVSPQSAQFRIIAATNRDLPEMVQDGEFREDLYYRIHVIPIHLPPLRERREDIPYLVEHILGTLNAPRRMVSKEIAQLLEYDWPGNVRQLRNALERFIAFGNLDFLPTNNGQRRGEAAAFGAGDALLSGKLRDSLAQYERKIICKTLDDYGWNRSQAAVALGLPRKTLFRKMKKLNISEPAQGLAASRERDVFVH